MTQFIATFGLCLLISSMAQGFEVQTKDYDRAHRDLRRLEQETVGSCASSSQECSEKQLRNYESRSKEILRELEKNEILELWALIEKSAISNQTVWRSYKALSTQTLKTHRRKANLYQVQSREQPAAPPLKNGGTVGFSSGQKCIPFDYHELVRVEKIAHESPLAVLSISGEICAQDIGTLADFNFESAQATRVILRATTFTSIPENAVLGASSSAGGN